MRLTQTQRRFLDSLRKESLIEEPNAFVQVFDSEIRTARSLEKRGLIEMNGDEEARLVPAKIKASEFDALLVRLQPAVALNLQGRIPRPMICLAVIQSLWIHQTPEGEDAAELRRQMLSLERTGTFDLEWDQ
jgi:hypothetical protein